MASACVLDSVGIIERTENRLLRGLSRRDRATLEPHVQRVMQDAGSILFAATDRLRWAYFPETALVSIVDEADPAPHGEVALVGCEGFVGWPALLGCERASHAAVVSTSGGRLLRVPIDRLVDCCRSSETLSASLLRFVHVVTVQMMRQIVSQRHDGLCQRLAVWLLARHDRIVGDSLPLGHEEIANALDVRRASVTDCLHVLEGELALRCHRRRIVIRDRARLEALAGPSYGVVEALHRELIGPFGKSDGGEVRIGRPPALFGQARER